MYCTVLEALEAYAFGDCLWLSVRDSSGIPQPVLHFVLAQTAADSVREYLEYKARLLVDIRRYTAGGLQSETLRVLERAIGATAPEIRRRVVQEVWRNREELLELCRANGLQQTEQSASARGLDYLVSVHDKNKRAERKLTKKLREVLQ